MSGVGCRSIHGAVPSFDRKAFSSIRPGPWCVGNRPRSRPLGIAVQDGNYIIKTGADNDYEENKDNGKKNRKNLVPMLNAFAKDFLKVNYIFWVNQKPYFKEDVIPCLSN